MTDEINDNTHEPLEIELPEEEVEGLEVAKEEDAPKVDDAPKEETVEDGLEDLKRQLEEERQAKKDAERRANEAAQREAEAAQQAYHARNEVQDVNLTLISNAIDQVRQNTDILKERYKQAISLGDADAQADIQVAISDNAAKLLQLEQGRQALEHAPKQQAPQPQRYQDPVEALASQMEATNSPRSAQWIRQHPEYATDSRLQQKMVAAHQIAVADGLAPDTDAYFESVENTLRIRKAEQQQERQIQARQPAPPAAPSSRQGSTTGSSQPNRIRLSAEEVEIAEMMGMKPEEYARNKVALQKSGQIR